MTRLISCLMLLSVCVVCLSVGCRSSDRTTESDARPHGPLVAGLALQLEVVAVPEGGHFPERSGVWGDGEPIHWPRMLRLSFVNDSETPKQIYVGLNVNGMPSLEDVYIYSRDLETGEQASSQRQIGSVWGSFDKHYVILGPGGRYSALLREARWIIQDPPEPNPDNRPRDVELYAEYNGGFLVYTGNKGKRKLVTETLRSNTVNLHGSGGLPEVVRNDANPPQTPSLEQRMHERWPMHTDAPKPTPSDSDQNAGP